MGVILLAIALFVLLAAYLGVSFALSEWWEESRPTQRALDAANVCRVINHFYVDGVCSQCGSIEPPRQ